MILLSLCIGAGSILISYLHRRRSKRLAWGIALMGGSATAGLGLASDIEPTETDLVVLLIVILVSGILPALLWPVGKEDPAS